jgi:hypothetical protein
LAINKLKEIILVYSKIDDAILKVPTICCIVGRVVFLLEKKYN